MNRKIILSSISIFSALAVIAGATFAYFTSTQTVSANTISTGSLDFRGYIYDEAGNPSKFTSNLAPGQELTRCMFVENRGTVPGRFKIYGTNESGDGTNIGNNLTISVKLNPTESPCETLPVPNNLTAKYGQSYVNFDAAGAWTDVAVRGAYLSSTTTPFKIDSASDPMDNTHYALFEVKVKLAPSVTTQGSSYTSDVTILGMQAEGSEAGSGW